MLALSRKKGEALIINNDIEVTILDIKGEQGLAFGAELTRQKRTRVLQVRLNLARRS